MAKLCSIDGCGNAIEAKSLCNKHYQRLCNHGDANYSSRAENGAGTIDAKGYRRLSVNGIKVKEHAAIAEKALGKPLPKGAVIHHVNGDKLDNRPENLVICPDEKYHHLLHTRTNAIDAGYPANYRKCKYCKEYDNPDLLIITTNAAPHHKECISKYHKRYYQLTKGVI